MAADNPSRVQPPEDDAVSLSTVHTAVPRAFHVEMSPRERYELEAAAKSLFDSVAKDQNDPGSKNNQRQVILTKSAPPPPAFPLFGQLPSEIRLKIWQIALRAEYEESRSLHIGRQGRFKKTFTIHPEPIRLIQYSSYEAFAEAARLNFNRVTPLDPTNSPLQHLGGLFKRLLQRRDAPSKPLGPTSHTFNPKRDVVFLDTGLVSTPRKIIHNGQAVHCLKLKRGLQLLTSVLPAEDTNKIRRLMIECRVAHPPSKMVLLNDGLDEILMESFRNLKEIAYEFPIPRCKNIHLHSCSVRTLSEDVKVRILQWRKVD